MTNMEFTKTVLDRLSGLLKPLGYRKRGLVFTLDLPLVVHLIELQKSRSSTSTEIIATVNVAIWVKELALIRAGKPDPPRVASAQWRERIGLLLPEFSDKWWSAQSPEAALEMAEEMALSVFNNALPVLGALTTVDALVELWKTGKSPGLTEHERAQNLFKLLQVNKIDA